MRIPQIMKAGTLYLTVHCALLTSVVFSHSAIAADDETDDITALTHPTNTVEFGSLYTSESSAKFGQYNGLNQEGFYGLGNFDIRGGAGYNNKGSALRWWLNGSNLGTTSRTLDGKIGEQGKWDFSIGWDELRHNITDTFQTPLQGNPGGNQFNLPSNFGAIDTSSSTALHPVVGTRNLSSTQLSAFHTQQEYVTRNNIPISGSFALSEQLTAKIDFNHLEQTGAKLLGTSTYGGAGIFTSGAGPTTAKLEGVNIIMNPTNYVTDNLNATLNWIGDKAHFSAGYYGSLFHDNYNSVSWQSSMASYPNPAGGPAGGPITCPATGCLGNNTMSTAPSNALHQANLTGGYNFTPTTKVAGGFSFGYNTQNASYAPTNILQPNNAYFNMMQANGLPVSSLNGLVETTHGDLKLTDQSFKDLTLTAGFKFDQRDNMTPSQAYKYNTLSNLAYTGVNTPYSNNKAQYEASAAYRISKAQNLNLTYLREDIQRWCNAVVGGAQCVASPTSIEDKINLSYRLKPIDDVTFTSGYSFAKRSASNDPNYLANSGNYANTTLASHTALNGGNVIGYVAYPYANRNQNIGKVGINWQITQKFDMGVNGRYTYDQYDATLGVKNGQSADVNVDATYNYQQDSSITAYWSWQNGQRNLSSGNYPNGSNQVVVPKNIFSNRLDDSANTFGIVSRQGGFLDGKLEFISDLSYALDTTGYSTQVYYNPGCAATTSLTCGATPAIKNELLTLKLTSDYKLHKNGKLALSYIFQQLNSNDYFYNAQQYGYTPSSLMPTNLKPQSYEVNVVGLSYSYKF